jgi:uncharacterized protein with HEPN domain
MEYKKQQTLEYFNDILGSVIDAQNFVRNKTRDEFLSDRLTIAAVTRCLENISRTAQSIRRLDRRRRYDNLPWREMLGMNRKINDNYQEIAPAVLWQTVEEEFDELEKQIRSILGDYIRDDIPKHSTKLNRIKFVSEAEEVLTPTLLIGQITPYLVAISDLQKIIDAILGQPSKPPAIKSISQNTPISVSLEGAIQATEMVRDEVVPWRRNHTRTIKELEEQEKVVQIETSKAEVLEIRARAQKERAEAKRIEADMDVELERKRLENQKLRQEIQEARVNLALKILDKLSAELSQEQKILMAMKLLEPLEVITSSPLLLDSEAGE